MTNTSPSTAWKSFVKVFVGVFAATIAVVYAFILLVDPYDVVPFSLPLDRRIVSINQRSMYPQIVRSGRFDSLVIGTSTARLVDPALLNAPFGARFANLAMDAMQAWEQYRVMTYFQHQAGPPKVLVVVVDFVWCQPDADRNRITPRGFPEWLYDDNPWNDYLHVLNIGTAEIAVRQLGYQLKLYRERVRFDGFEVFTPPEDRYDLARARHHLWMGRTPGPVPDNPALALTDAERAALSFPALKWLEAVLADLPASSRRILALPPVHISAQPLPGSRAAAVENECRERIVALARRHAATVIDWRLASSITREDSNYWDRLHYRQPIAQRFARELVAAAIEGRDSEDGSYVIRVRGNEAAAR